MVLRHENRELVFRKENFKYVHQFYECTDSGERFTDTKLDEANIFQVYNQYRAKYGIPFPDEIKEIRKQYGLSASKMSSILGFGDNQYRLYENGDMPSEANGKIIMSIKNPYVFETFILNSQNQISTEEMEKIMERISDLKLKYNENDKRKVLFHGLRRDIFNGFAEQRIGKLKNILLFFLEGTDGVFQTKMNKLLFYADFLCYKRTGRGISGLSYKAIQRGPVPQRWDRIYSFYDDIQQEIVIFPNGIEGCKIITSLSPDKQSFTDYELEVLRDVKQRFISESSNSISELSHSENAWSQYEGTNQLISFNLAFELKAI